MFCNVFKVFKNLNVNNTFNFKLSPIKIAAATFHIFPLFGGAFFNRTMTSTFLLIAVQTVKTILRRTKIHCLSLKCKEIVNYTLRDLERQKRN